MIWGLDTLGAAGLLIFAGSTIQCTVPQPPKISVNPVSAPIAYEFSLSAEELGRFKVDTVSPYAPGTDLTTGGLRHDRPKIETAVKWGVRSFPGREAACLWYNDITVNINLNPKIYIARDHTSPACRNAILEHEKKHVAVDRQVINRFSRNIGQAIKSAVDQAGAMGPYKLSEVEKAQQRLVKHIEAAIDTQTFLMQEEMRRHQAAVDSLEEYERVGKICDEGEK